MNPYLILAIDDNSPLEKVERATFNLLTFWSKNTRIEPSMREQCIANIIWAYKVLMPMIPREAFNQYYLLHEVNEFYLNSLEPDDRRFYEMVVDYYALSSPKR